MSEDPELEQRLRAMFSGRAEAVESQLSGPALRARAARRPSTMRRYAPPVIAAAVVAALAIGLAVADSGGGDGRPSNPVGGSVAPATITDRPSTSHPSPSRPSPARRSSRPPLAPTYLPAPGRLDSPSVSRGRSSTTPAPPGVSGSGAPAVPRRSTPVSRTVALPPS